MIDIILTIVLIVLGVGFSVSVSLFAVMRRERKELLEEIAIGRRENSALLDRIETLTAENNEFRQQNRRLYKVTMPSFGEPKLKRYNPLDYPAPLVCPSCKETLVAKENFYEIPITNEPGTVVAVHLRCEREAISG